MKNIKLKYKIAEIIHVEFRMFMVNFHRPSRGQPSLAVP